MKTYLWLLLIFPLTLLFSPPASAEEIYTKDGISFSIETPSEWGIRTLPREDLAYLAVGVKMPYITSVSVRMARSPKRAALLNNPGMNAAYLADPKRETVIETGTTTVSWIKAYYCVTSSKEFMEKDQKDLYQIEKKISFARGEEVFTISFAATGTSLDEASEHFDALKTTFDSVLSSFHLQ